MTDFALAGNCAGLGDSGLASAGILARVSRCNIAPSAIDPKPRAQSWKKCRRVRLSRNSEFISCLALRVQKGLILFVDDFKQAVGLQDFEAVKDFRGEPAQDDSATFGLYFRSRLYH